MGERSWERGVGREELGERRRRRKEEGGKGGGGRKEREDYSVTMGLTQDSLTSTYKTMPEIHNHACPKWQNI